MKPRKRADAAILVNHTWSILALAREGVVLRDRTTSAIASVCKYTQDPALGDQKDNHKSRPGDVSPNCPGDNGKIIQNGGKKWKIFCELSTSI
jgi:hypothetical protein